MVEQPSGTVTLVFTDIEGSTRLLRELGREPYREVLAAHRRIVRQAFARHGGYEVDHEGDGFFYAFASAGEALAAVEGAMQGLESGPIRLRVGVHTGEPGRDGKKYVGLEVHLAARVMAAGHGGQVLVTRATRELVGVELIPLGEHRLKDISEPVYLYQLGESEFPPLRSLNRTNLPLPATAFLGRRQELKQLRSLLARDEVRLVTLTGPGGTGKTRLALEIGGELAQEREVLFVDLSTANSEEATLQALAVALAVRDQAGVGLLEGVSTALAVRAPLVILDNCEQIAGAVAALVQAFLSRIPDLRLLATSREPLHVEGEYCFALAPLPVPGADDPRPERSEAVRMFFDRVRMAAPAFTADPASVVAAAEIVRGLDGLPLAIELAASRSALLGVAAVRDRLDQRFRILKATGESAVGRHRSLEAALEWSYQLLDPSAQTAFSRLSVFPTSFSLAAAEAILGPDALDIVPALADVSLLTIDDAGQGVYRYRLLDTIRAYASGKLAETENRSDAQQSLASWAVVTAEAAALTLNTPNETDGLSILDQEGDNCAAALAWMLQTEPAEALRLALALSGWRMRRGRYAENAHALARALEDNPDMAADVRARMLLELSWPTFRLGDRADAERLASEAAVLFAGLADHVNTVKALVRAAGSQRNQGRLEEAAAAASKALELAQEHEDPNGIAAALSELGFAALYAGDFTGAYDKAKEALQVSTARLSAETQSLRQALLTMAGWLLGELAEVETACLAEIATTNDYSAHRHKGVLAAVRDEQGRRLEALQLLRESFEFAAAVGDKIEITNGLQDFAAWAVASGRFETAALLEGAAEREFPNKLPMEAKTRSAKLLAVAKEELGAEKYTANIARGSELTTAELVDLVRDLDRRLRSEGEHGPVRPLCFPPGGRRCEPAAGIAWLSWSFSI